MTSAPQATQKLNQNLYEDLEARGLVHQVTDPQVRERLNQGNLTVYLGFDPTANSLHVGNLLGLVTLKRMQTQGHRIIALVGGATGFIGDPSGKSAERQLLTAEQINLNAQGISAVISRFVSLDGTRSHLVNNLDWFKKISVIDYLREIGKHFTVNYMLAKDSVQSRLQDREHGISYTEFSYMLLQGYDYFELNQKYGCNLQVGGADQWGNITAGTEYIRRRSAADELNIGSVYGLTWPLITKADGTKFGKSESGTIWLSADRTSPYDFYQYFLRASDQDVMKWLFYFSEQSLESLKALEVRFQSAPEKREAQKILAEELTLLVHGQVELDKVRAASNLLFSGSSEKTALSEAILQNAPFTEKSKELLQTGISILDLLVESKLVSSKGNARSEITGGGIYLNNERVTDVNLRVVVSHVLFEKYILLRRGKKTFHAFRFG